MPDEPKKFILAQSFKMISTMVFIKTSPHDRRGDNDHNIQEQQHCKDHSYGGEKILRMLFSFWHQSFSFFWK
jgi:hypothetical protein